MVDVSNNRNISQLLILHLQIPPVCRQPLPCEAAQYALTKHYTARWRKKQRSVKKSHTNLTQNHPSLPEKKTAGRWKEMWKSVWKVCKTEKMFDSP